MTDWLKRRNIMLSEKGRLALPLFNTDSETWSDRYEGVRAVAVYGSITRFLPTSENVYRCHIFLQSMKTLE